MSASMLPPPPKTEHSKDDDYLRQQWANHLNTQYENYEAAKAGEDAVVERIVVRAGNGRNTNKEEIEKTYEIIRRRVDPTSLKATVEQEYIVAEAQKCFHKWGVTKPREAWGFQHEASVGQKTLIDDIVSRYGEKYKELSAIGSVYLLYKRPFPEAEDFLVRKWMSFWESGFSLELERRKKRDQVVEDITYCFGVVRNEADIKRWYLEHAKAEGFTNYPVKPHPLVDARRL
ncbi:predicted protein [Sclerotinia sclerotiorum 1980 UF-70]|uniref:Uncharacterized protein n=2 Tax=Sclerotinia sclerotiorum (strain ATCC 18683 / 1980 / Ss-1) TaxID=665079 RepID=A7EVH3_SCLS1|nr:predicted protein [Sclerotinia sclerotiorum 1980 UF-70]APA15811.1 hypothetical protein sscle_15g105810 [Sclerotinia sclerotiorum 1980 UF-70]EDN93465.1 predicted protein [Sclerotinia sclerotiorum 1980 UF-70]